MSAPTTDESPPTPGQGADPAEDLEPGVSGTADPAPAAPAALAEGPEARASRPSTGLPVWLAGPIAAGWTAFIGLFAIALPMMVAWAVSAIPGMGIDGAARTTGLLWLVSHDVALRVGTATYSLLPWGLMLGWLLLLVIAGRWAARTTAAGSVRDGVLLVLTGALAYGGLLAAVSAVAETANARTSPIRAFGIGFALAVLGLTWGALRGTLLGMKARELTPAPVRVIARAALAALLAMVALGALLAGIAVAASFDEALRMQQFLDPGVVGGLVLLVLALGYLPSAIMWTVAYALGAGITVGPEVVLSPFVQAQAPTNLPAFPLLAALPGQGGPIAFALPAVGIVAGIVAGVVIARHATVPALQRLGIAVVAVAIAAIALSIGTRLSFGSLGDARLVGLGPSSESVALISAVLMLIGAVPTALIGGRRERTDDVG